VGAISDPIDDADFYDPIYIDQLYYQQNFIKGKAQVRAGYLDLQTIIDRNAFANSEDVQFMTTFLDNNNAIVPLKIGLGATLLLYPTDWFSLTAGLIDADNRIRHAGWETAFDDFESLMVYAEAGFKPKISSSRGPLVGNYRIGVLHDPRGKTIFSTSDLPEPEKRSGDPGVYVSFDQMLVPEEANSTQGLGAFFRWGRRTSDVNRLTDLWSTGLQYRGLFKGRDGDLLGFGTYSVYGSKDYQEYVNPEFDRETGYEIYYSFQVTPWLTFTPDFQYIDNPGAKESIEDAVVFVFRTRFTF
jgi:carbohydrate-selective porin OprB